MKKKDKVTAIQITGCRPNPEKLLKELNLDANPEWTIHYFFKPHIGGIMYDKKRKK